MENCNLKSNQHHKYYGLELRLAGAMHAGEIDSSIFSYSLFDKIGFQLLRRLYMRPAIEPVLHSYCGVFNPYNVRIEMLGELNGALRGVKFSVRTSNPLLRNETALKYCPTKDAKNVLRNLDELCAPYRGDPLRYAASLYHNILYAHYYADGNGRLARAVFSLVMYKLGMLSDPYIPISITSYMNIGSTNVSLHELCHETNIENTVQRMKTFVEPCTTPRTQEIITRFAGLPTA